MIKVGVDEFNVTLFVNNETKINMSVEDWPDIAEHLISKASSMLCLEEVFGIRHIDKTKPPVNGYTIGYSFGIHSHYLTASYHDLRPDMGVCIRFSGQALASYCESTHMQVYKMLRRLDFCQCEVRLSKIDLKADYIDEGLSADTVYRDYVEGKTAIVQMMKHPQSETFYPRKIDYKTAAIAEGATYKTGYYGSKKSEKFLRVYDKKRQQIESHGIEYDVAIRCDDWVRFEVVLRRKYAQSVGLELMKIENDEEYQRVICSYILKHFRFMCIDKNGKPDAQTTYTQALEDLSNGSETMLSTPYVYHGELAKNIEYMIFGSGILSTLHKIKNIWGDIAVEEMLSLISSQLESYEPSKSCRKWLITNAEDYKKSYDCIGTYLRASAIDKGKM